MSGLYEPPWVLYNNAMNTNVGVYALRHRATGKIYIGSSMNLRARRQKWWQRMNADRQNLSPAMRALTTSRNDWDFLVLWDGTGKSSVELQDAERRAVAAMRQKAPDRLLNMLSVQRPDTGGLAAGGKTQSLNAWSRETGVPRATISARLSYGWTSEQAVGLVDPPMRDYRNEHIDDSIRRSAVVVVDGDHPLSHSAAAALLGCRLNTLRERLKRYRVPGGQGRVQIKELQELSAKFRRD